MISFIIDYKFNYNSWIGNTTTTTTTTIISILRTKNLRRIIIIINLNFKEKIMK